MKYEIALAEMTPMKMVPSTPNGDINSHFFPSFASTRIRMNSIESLTHEDGNENCYGSVGYLEKAKRKTKESGKHYSKHLNLSHYAIPPQMDLCLKDLSTAKRISDNLCTLAMDKTTKESQILKAAMLLHKAMEFEIASAKMVRIKCTLFGEYVDKLNASLLLEKQALHELDPLGPRMSKLEYWLLRRVQDYKLC
ncbi:hypothetical protein JHK84_028269 [Glycine max]|nr:hypothetical protein JHK85_028683 [Glycine max]KAG5151797.1 hypothetical protein JHK84_028269 [Glycine max]